MILNNDFLAEAVISSNMETSTAKVDMSVHLMDLLSSGIYTDKITATIREISCNALDANIEAGKGDVPIEVHIPTPYEQWFSVRDSGTGLSHEDIMELYMTYGKSTKQGSNMVIGGFGIGKFSPFSYTDAFTVTSRFNGKKRSYSIYKNKGIPQCTLLSTEITTESNGIEVKVPVRSEDRYSFKTKAEGVFKAFDVKPTTNVTLDMELSVAKCFKGGFSTNWVCGNANFYAKVGAVIYAIDHPSVGEFLKTLGRDKSYYFEFQIGEVDIAGSRESLSMTERTDRCITERIENLMKDILQEKMDEIEGSETLFSFISGVKSCGISIIEDTVKFQGKTFDEWKSYYNNISLNYGVDCYVKHWGAKCKKVTLLNETVGSLLTPFNSSNSRTVLVKDIKNGGITEFKALASKRSGRYIPVFEDIVQAEDFIKTMGWDGCSIKLASELKSKSQANKREVVQVEIMQESKRRGITTTKVPNFDILSVKKAVWFVETSRDKWMDGSGDYHSNFDTFEDAISGGFVSTVFFIRSATVRKLTNPKSKLYNPNFKRFDAGSVFGRLSGEDCKVLAMQSIKDKWLINDSAFQIISEAQCITPRQHRLLTIAKKYDADWNAHYSAKIKLHCKANMSVYRKITESVGSVSEEIYKVMYDAYPFLDSMANYYSDGQLKAADSMLPYIKHLIKSQNSGVFSEDSDTINL